MSTPIDDTKPVLPVDQEPFASMLVDALHDEDFADWFGKFGGFRITAIKHKIGYYTMPDEEYITGTMKDGYATRAQAEAINSARRFCRARVIRYYHAYQQQLPPEHPMARKLFMAFCEEHDEDGLGLWEDKEDTRRYYLKDPEEGYVIECSYVEMLWWTRNRPNYYIDLSPDAMTPQTKIIKPDPSQIKDIERTPDLDDDDDDLGFDDDDEDLGI